jgi:hypothetical protein
VCECSGDIEGKISQVMSESMRAKEDLGRAEGHLESLKKTLDRMDNLSASQQVREAEGGKGRGRTGEDIGSMVCRERFVLSQCQCGGGVLTRALWCIAVAAGGSG